MNVLITGGTGFIGQHLLEELAGDDLQITVISRKQNPEFWCANKNFKIIQADISNKKTLEDAFSSTEVVINLAAELKSSANFESANILGTKNIVELSEVNKIKKIIHLSSVGVVGMQYSLTKTVVDETTPCHPKNEYERTKLRSEEIMKGSKVPYVILRPTNVFGDHHPRQALLGFFQHIKEQRVFLMKKDAVVNYVYAKDVAHAIRYFVTNNAENRIINIGEATSLKEYAEMTSRLLGVSCTLKNMPDLLFAMANALGYFGMFRMKEKLRGISNCVEYADSYMKNTIGYKYGVRNGLLNSILFYKLK